MGIRHVIFDADDTLIRFGEDEKRAFRIAFGEDAPIELLEDMRRFEYAHWDEVRLHEVDDPEIAKNFHSLYYEHLKAVFDYAESRYALGSGRKETEQKFFKALCLPAHFTEGALETVKNLSSRYSVWIATNGLGKMQRGRLAEFLPCVKDVFISEELGKVKPSPEFGEEVLSRLGAKGEECIWVGDSLRSDVALANSLHIPCVWYNPASLPPPENVQVYKTIANLNELLSFL